MAEGIFKKLLSDRGIENVTCSSAGLFAMTGDEASPNAIKAAERFGADISAHRARRITSFLLDETDLFVCMTGQHAASLSMYVPEDKIKVLAEGIFDPFGGDLETYILCAASIKEALVADFEALTAVKKND